MSELERTQQDSSNTPKPLSLQQNLILMLKIFAIAGGLIALLWFGSEAVSH